MANSLGQIQDRKFDTVVQIVTQSKWIDVFKDCNAIQFTNIGDTAVTVDEKILFPSATPATVLGDAVSYGGNENEVYAKQSVKVSFANPGGVNPKLEIVQKFYV